MGNCLFRFFFFCSRLQAQQCFALSIIEKSATEDSFFMQIVEFAAGYFTFSLLYFPAVIITNLWSLHLVKQLHEQQPVNVLSAFFKSIGLKFFLLIPLMFVWMFFQMLFAFFLLIIGIRHCTFTRACWFGRSRQTVSGYDCGIRHAAIVALCGYPGNSI